MMSTQTDNPYDLFYKKSYKKALDIFSKQKEYYPAGMCSLLLGHPLAAERFWKRSKSYCPASNFGLCVLRMIKLQTDRQPSFFQTRAQLEIYINLFIENNLIEWAENLISCADFLYRSNPESYKFIARALYANGYFELAINFCKKSLNIFYSDPEALLIMSQCYYLLKNNGEALDIILRVLDIVPDYFPAIIFEKVIREEIKNKNK